ncbi:transient receptor potential cation channel subfamily A member 1 isoform X2 [Hydra vulgaris]|uniref:Transient receptor potential cation channel subfamily A member 1 isoform X2 n=1 Tax=Hydra vulgaris TaxID=6087 RepID=A0ABM4BIF7_HYDVU
MVSKNIAENFLKSTQKIAFDVKNYFFAKSNDENYETMSLKSFRSKSILKSSVKVNTPNIIEDFEKTNEKTPIDCSRNLIVDPDNLFRKGPIPIEKLSFKDQTHLSLKACLKEMNDNDKNLSSVREASDPASEMLLHYFARLGNGADDEDTVNLQFVKALLDEGASLNFTDCYGQSVFFAIVRDWHVNVASFAIEKRADVNHKDKYGRTPLHLAAAIDYSAMIEILIKNGALIDAVTTGEEQSALHYAARYNAIHSIEVLISHGAKLDSVDFLLRTPLHVAVEFGSHKAVKYFLEIGVPVGTYDSYGNSAVGLMVEKLPSCTYEAMNQFIVNNNSTRKIYYYLDCLQFDVKYATKVSKSVLQMVVMHNRFDLIMHPVLQKLLNVNWKLFGRRHAVISNFWNVLYTMLATILVYSIPFTSYDQQYSPPKAKAWKIVIACVFFVLTFYFLIKQLWSVIQNTKCINDYKNYKITRLKKQKQYFHPAWFEEQQFYEEEFKRISNLSANIWNDLWNIFEFMLVVVVLLTYILHIINIIKPNMRLFKAANYVSCIMLLFVYFRLYKTLRIFSIFSVFTVLLGHVLEETIRILLLFLDFYVPYLFIIFMLFGGKNGYKQEGELNNSGLENFDDVTYNMWLIIFGKSYPHKSLEETNIYVSQVAFGLYFILMTIFFIYIYIGRLNQVFCNIHQQTLATSNMMFASIMVNEENSLKLKDKMKQKKFLRHSCGPMEVNYECTSRQVNEEHQSSKIHIDHIVTSVDNISAFLSKSNLKKKKKNTINLENFSIFNTEVQKLTQRQQEMEHEFSELKKRVATEQQKSLDSIKEAVDAHLNEAAANKRKLEKES